MREKGRADLLTEIEDLKARLREAEEHLEAIRSGGVDALVISGPRGQQVFTLNEADRPYRIIIEEMTEGTVTTNAEGTILYSNKQFASMLGIPLQRLIGSSVYDYIDRKDLPLINRLTGKRKKKTGRTELFFRNIKKPIWANVSVSPLKIEKDPVFCWIITDVTKARTAQDALQGSLQVIEDLYNNAPCGYHSLDENGVFIRINDTELKWLGYSRKELLGKNFTDVVTDQGKEIFRMKFPRFKEQGWVNDLEFDMIRKDGTIAPMILNATAIRDETGRFLSSRATLFDLTERRKTEEEKKKLEAQAMQVQKMESLGRLAGGIAHDLNNILYPIIIDTELLLEDAKPGSTSHYLARQVLDAAYRQRDLIRQILGFSKKREWKLMPINIGPLINEAGKLMRASLPSSIEIKIINNAGTDTILGDPTQIHQIIMNLCRNAADALESQKGTIEIKIRNVQLDQSEPMGLKAGQYLQLSVRDTGCGIPSEIKNQIFDPFFTTKEKGSGMGLAMVHGIINGHGGSIDVDSEQGKGSVFTMHLPVTTEKPVNSSPEKRKPRQAKARGRILLVDDEKPILASLGNALQRSGYKVTGFEDSLRALDIFNRDPHGFDLVITDLTMPKMSGIEIAKKLMDIKPGIPVILCTGFDDIINEEDAKNMGIRRLLTKPVTWKELEETISRELDI